MRTLLLHTSLAVGLVLIGLSGCKKDDDDGDTAPVAGAAGDTSVGGTGGSSGGTGGTAGSSGGTDAGGAAGAETGGRGGTPLTGELEVFSWWRTGGERGALEALFKLLNPAWPETGDGVEIVFTEQTDGPTSRTNLQNRLEAGNPPDVFQENAGMLIQDRAKTGVVADLSDLSFWSAMNQDVVAQVSVDGKPYAVPVTVARINSIFYSKAVLGAEYQAPTTLEQFHSELERVKAMGDVVPLALGNGGLWTMNLMVWEAVMPAVAGADYYDRFWHGTAEIGLDGADDPMLQNVLREALVLYCGVDNVEPEGLTLKAGSSCDGYYDSDVMTNEKWDEKVAMVGAGTAAFTPMGDWAKGTLLAADYTLDDFGVFQFPGEDVFVWTADALAMTNSAPNPENAIAFLEHAGSQQGQINFNLQKGSIPVRADATDGLDTLSLGILDQFDNAARRVPARSTLGVEPAMGGPSGNDLAQQLMDALLAHDMTTLHTYIVDHYAEVAAIYE